jgi:hypothetical protein
MLEPNRQGQEDRGPGVRRRPLGSARSIDLLWALAASLFAVWSVGSILRWPDGAVHVLLALAVAAGVLRLAIGRRREAAS